MLSLHPCVHIQYRNSSQQSTDSSPDPLLPYILGQTQQFNMHSQKMLQSQFIDICSTEGECICQIETSIICTLKGVIVAVAL